MTKKRKCTALAPALGAMTREESRAVFQYMVKLSDREEMRRAMFRDPARLLGARLCTLGAPWCRVQLRNDVPIAGIIEARFSILRRRHSVDLPDEPHPLFDPVDPLHFDPNSAVRVRHFDDQKIAEYFRFRLHDSTPSAFDELFSEFVWRAKRFFGEGTFQLFEVLSNEQAWQRIKAL